MVKTYHAAQQWDHWLTQFLGRSLLEAECITLSRLLDCYYGKQALLIGVPHQKELLNACVTRHSTLLTPLTKFNKKDSVIEGEFHALPILSASLDLVILPHTLEYTSHARQVFSEACRVIKPEGHIVILGFNNLSFWGLKKYLLKNKHAPWSHQFFSHATIKNWLRLADFEIIKQDKLLFRPPLQPNLYEKVKFLEWIGRKCYRPFGGVYLVIAQAKVIPLTPIRLRWQQTLSNASIPMPGSTMRDF